MDPERIRDELRGGRSRQLTMNRRFATLSVLGVLDFALLSLFQVGVIRHLPDPPGRFFDSDRVNASRKAYALGIPDATLGALLFAVNLVLASAGGSRRTGRPRLFGLAMGGTALAGAASAIHYLWDMIRNQKRACPYCIAGAMLYLALVPPAIPGALAALEKKAPDSFFN